MAKAALLMLATYMDPDGSVPQRFRPSVRRLSADIGSPSADGKGVEKMLRQAEARGFLAREAGRSHEGHVRGYFAALPATAERVPQHPLLVESGSPGTPERVSQDPLSVQSGSPKTPERVSQDPLPTLQTTTTIHPPSGGAVLPTVDEPGTASSLRSDDVSEEWGPLWRHLSTKLGADDAGRVLAHLRDRAKSARSPVAYATAAANRILGDPVQLDQLVARLRPGRAANGGDAATRVKALAPEVRRAAIAALLTREVDPDGESLHTEAWYAGPGARKVLDEVQRLSIGAAA